MQKVLYTNIFKVSAAKSWQDSGFLVKKWFDNVEKDMVNVVTIKATEGSTWSYNNAGSTGMVNMDALTADQKTSSSTSGSMVAPYSQADGKVGQLLFKIGKNGVPAILGTSTLNIDSRVSNNDKNKLNLNPASCKNEDTVWLCMNDSWTMDNTGEVEIIFEVMSVETEESKIKRSAQQELEEKSKKIEELSQALKDKDAQLVELSAAKTNCLDLLTKQDGECAKQLQENEQKIEELLSAKEQCELTLKEKDEQIARMATEQEKAKPVKEVIHSQKCTISPLKGWQDSGFAVNGWFDSPEKDRINVLTVRAKEGAAWSFGYGLLNMDGKDPVSNKFASADGSITLPYSKPDGTVGQLLFKIGEHGVTIPLGTNTLTLDRSASSKAVNNLYLNPANYGKTDTIWLRMNDLDDGLYNNFGEAEIIFEVVATPVSRRVVHTRKFQISAKQGWQDSQFQIYGWDQAKDGTFYTATIKAAEGASWRFVNQVNRDGLDMVNMDGFYLGSNKSYNMKCPFTKQDGRAGQLIFKLGENGEARVLGTNTIILDGAKENDYLCFNPNKLNPTDTFKFRMNDDDCWLGDNEGTVEIIYEVEETKFVR